MYPHAIVTQYIITGTAFSGYLLDQWNTRKTFKLFYLYLYIFWCTSFLYVDLSLWPSSWRSPKVSCKAGLLAANSPRFFCFVFCLSEKILISISLLKDNSLDMEFEVGVFSFQRVKYFVLPLLTLMVSEELSHGTLTLLPRGVMFFFFSFWLLSRYSLLSLNFCSSNMICLSIVFLVFILFFSDLWFCVCS